MRARDNRFRVLATGWGPIVRPVLGAVGVVAGVMTMLLRERLATHGLGLFDVRASDAVFRWLVAANVVAGVGVIVLGLALITGLEL